MKKVYRFLQYYHINEILNKLEGRYYKSVKSSMQMYEPNSCSQKYNNCGQEKPIDMTGKQVYIVVT